ncbi:MAG TPA: hypothetical protein VG411_20860, partial [Actinomycetota bacterium]|nr:hypothetical protein [Actinomycetota bacterium]
QRHSVLGFPFGVVKKHGDDQGGRHAALLAGVQIEGSIRAIQGSGLALAVGVAGTLWGGLGITQSFQDAMNERADLLGGSFLLNLALLLVIFQILTGMAVRWRWLLPGAAVGALYAAEINVVLARRLWPRSLLQAPLTEPDRRVLTALARNEERRPEQRVQVSFLPEDAGADAQPPADRDRR